MTGKSTLPTPGVDVQHRPPPCDVCGPAEDVHRLEGPQGDLVACQRCIALLADQAGLTVYGPDGTPLA